MKQLDFRRFGALLARAGCALALVMAVLLARLYFWPPDDLMSFARRNPDFTAQYISAYREALVFDCFFGGKDMRICPGSGLFRPAFWGGALMALLGTIIAASARKS